MLKTSSRKRKADWSDDARTHRPAIARDRRHKRTHDASSPATGLGSCAGLHALQRGSERSSGRERDCQRSGETSNCYYVAHCHLSNTARGPKKQKCVNSRIEPAPIRLLDLHSALSLSLSFSTQTFSINLSFHQTATATLPSLQHCQGTQKAKLSTAGFEPAPIKTAT